MPKNVKLIEKKVNDTVNRETLEKCSKKTKLQEIAGDNAGLKEYLKCLTWENARTVFEVRTNMLKLTPTTDREMKNVTYVESEKQQSTYSNVKEDQMTN